MRVRVVTDSSSSVPDEYLARLGIGEALASVNFGGESYLAKADLSLDAFYERLEKGDKLPTTSQPTPQQFALAYERAAAAGADEIVAVCVSGALSGTLNSAVVAAQIAPVPVHVWDTRHISMASGFQAITAAELARDGHDSQAILDALAGIRDRIYMAFTPANLRYIVASGRVPRLRGAVGDVLNIKPILTTVEGRLEPIAQVRSQRRAIEQILDGLAAVLGDRPARVALGHCRAKAEADRVWEAMRTRLNVVEVVQFDLGVVLASLAGPGLIGMGGYTIER
jgi:DegV family protein with EDD domain